MEKNSYNPDVLNCLANLSNDEVFTPPTVATQMIDLLPQELFRSPETRFLDPFSKSGVFLREIVKRLDRGLQEVIPDRQQRIDHILHKQVFGIAITELTAHLSRRTLYCSKDASSKYSVSHFDTPEGNMLYTPLQHTWGSNDKCIYCGASRSVYDRGDAAEQYAYQFIHTDNPQKIFPNMKFDVIIGNPPYQLNDGGNGASAKPIYNLFVEQAKKLSPRYLIMITPSRWFAGGKGLDDYRNSMLTDKRIKVLVDYANAKDCFPNNSIGGGVSYFLLDSTWNGKCEVVNVISETKNVTSRFLDEYPVFIRYNEAIGIVSKVKALKEKTIESIITNRNPFGLSSKERGHTNKKSGDVLLITSQGNYYIERDSIEVNKELVDTYNVLISKVTSEHAGEPDKDGKFKVLSRTEVIGKEVVCTDSYILIGKFKTKDEALYLYSYLSTMFVRFMLLLAVSSINLSRDKFQFVPIQDFSHPWTDEMLYKKYGLEQKEIDFIESMIRPME